MFEALRIQRIHLVCICFKLLNREGSKSKKKLQKLKINPMSIFFSVHIGLLGRQGNENLAYVLIFAVFFLDLLPQIKYIFLLQVDDDLESDSDEEQPSFSNLSSIVEEGPGSVRRRRVESETSTGTVESDLGPGSLTNINHHINIQKLQCHYQDTPGQ